MSCQGGEKFITLCGLSPATFACDLSMAILEKKKLIPGK